MLSETKEQLCERLAREALSAHHCTDTELSVIFLAIADKAFDYGVLSTKPK